MELRWRPRDDRRGARRWSAGDLLLWVALAAPVGYAGATPPYPRQALPQLVVSLALLALAVGISRRLPLTALVTVVLGSLLDGNFVFAIPVFSYLAGRRSPGVARATVLFGVLAAAGTALNLGLLGTGAATWFLLASVLLFAGVFPWLLGRYRWQQQALTAAERRHTEAVERERHSAVERIRLRERARIAQDMHDSLGHELSLIALRAAALELADDLPPRHRAAAGELRASVAAATERLHEIIGLLREERPASVRPAGESVAELVQGARDAGMTVALRGEPDDPDLPPMVTHAAHRVVREALTNAARYAPGAPVTVTLSRADDRLRVSVVNARPGTAPLPGPPSHGSGLLALGERVRLAGGVLDAGPHDGGFAVLARLPLTGAPGGAAVPAADAVPVPGEARGEVDPDPSSLDHPEGLPPPSPAGAPVDALRDARRRVRRSLLVAFGAPVTLGLVLSLVYHPLATAGAVLDRSGYERMRIGDARDELGLPRRQAEPPDPDAPDGCEYYTDGNFPFAEPTWRLCFTDGRLVSKEWIGQ